MEKQMIKFKNNQFACKKYYIGFLILCMFTQGLAAQNFYPGNRPLQAKALVEHGDYILENNLLKFEIGQKNKSLTHFTFLNKETGDEMLFEPAQLFRMETTGSETFTGSSFYLNDKIEIHKIKGEKTAIKYADRFDGWELVVNLHARHRNFQLQWIIQLRDNANYVHQDFVFSAKDSLNIKKIALLRFKLNKHVQVCGQVDGSPIIDKNMFFVLEHPMSQIHTMQSYIECFLTPYSHLGTGKRFTYSTAFGVHPPNQLRRGFLYYIERERAAPYHQFLHYNSWFDISWADKKLNEEECLDRIKTYADSLIVKRHVPMDGFLFDDGWDDNHSLWEFNKGFPNGFTPLKKLAADYKASLGVWISPWGGYDEAKAQRLKYGKLQHPPFETNADGFSLSGPHYYKRFFTVAKDFVTKYGVAIFKFDGIGSLTGANGITKGIESGDDPGFQKDFSALLKLIGSLRQIEPDLFFSLTIGTWPSPSWLKYADVIWRSGYDNGQIGQGNERQRWLNFRDANIYNNIVQRAPLYPLNALMNHGICIAQNGLPGKYEKDDKNIADEIWSFFGTGTSLQEMYINPHLLNTADWDCLAKAVQWSRLNKAELKDVHWVGGSPAKGEVYGYCGWQPGRGVLSLRNPSDKAQSISLTTKQIFELPRGYKDDYRFQQVNAYANNKARSFSGSSFVVKLAPFEVLVLQAKINE